MNAHGVAYAPQQFPPNAFYNAQNKGTLQPGQLIQIQSLTVTVERFLSQGGFAHVYLVRSAAPINGTIHHVLKRMLVADPAMLKEVNKEVDVMRVLRGHANIVNLIDSTINRLPDGRHEVFILMEFCAGGGIIDMMNRRLRERLTEGEILQIFVDVCEGVAAMHYLKPALLHRDLKVENILQANETSYKLCDFGSAATVTRPPTTPPELQALENDLNRHTTLQYRAPEMVDPHLRRPIDEKSDVWALGVLLYKLCYYTTPFEEHGPLAILNVQYKIPPYPVYSQRLITLITSMLREHGTQRPTVFQLLDMVHQMRGTKSRFRYNIPPPVLSPTLPRSPEDIVTFRDSAKGPSGSSQFAAAMQARQHIPEAIAPMRRGRPNMGGAGGIDDLDLPTPRGAHFKSITTNERWAPSTREAPAALGGSGRPMQLLGANRPNQAESNQQSSPWDGLGSLGGGKDTVNGFGDSFDPGLLAARRNLQPISGVQSTPPADSSSTSSSQKQQSTVTSSPVMSTHQSRMTMPTPSRLLQARPPMQPKKDSFEDIVSGNLSPPSSSMPRPPSNSSIQNGLVSAFSRPSTAADSIISTGTGVSSVAVVEGAAALSAAERFPSIEQLESIPREKPQAPLGPRAPSPMKPSHLSQNRPSTYSQLSKLSLTGGLPLDHDILTPPPPVPMSGVRSQQVTGTAMKGPAPAATNLFINPLASHQISSQNLGPLAGGKSPPIPPSLARFTLQDRPPSRFLTAERPLAPHRKPTRKQNSISDNKPDTSAVVKKQPTPPQHDLLGPTPPGHQVASSQPTPSPSAAQRDWLMDDDIVLNTIAKSSTGSMQPRLPTPDTAYTDPNKAKRATMGTALISNGRGAPISAIPSSFGGMVGKTPVDLFNPSWQRSGIPQATTQSMQPPSTRPDVTSSGPARPGAQEVTSPLNRRRSNTVSRSSQNEPLPPLLPPRPTQQVARAPSPAQKAGVAPLLTENWSPVEAHFPTPAKSAFGETQTGADSSENDEGPEDVESADLNRMRMRMREQAKAQELRNENANHYASSSSKTRDTAPQYRQHEARQGSVHDLVDIWGGGSKPPSVTSPEPSQSFNSQSGHQKAPSRDLMKFPESSNALDSPIQTSYNRAVHLFPPLDSIERRASPSSASGSEKDTDAPRPPPPQKRFSGSRGRPAHLQTDRARPQSLFIPSLQAGVSFPTSKHSPQDSLAIPSPSQDSPHSQFNRQRTPRRGSISDMVSRYEALSVVSGSGASGYTASTESGPASPKPKPVLGTKPVGSRPLGAHTTMPPSGAIPLPGLDSAIKDSKMNAPMKMRTSPSLFKSIASPTESTSTSANYMRDKDSSVGSYHTQTQNLQPPASEQGRSGSPRSASGTISDTNEDILLVSPRPRPTPHHSIDLNNDAALARARTPPARRSASPEQVYRGVGKLIDQWQKKSEENDAKARVGQRPGGPRQQRKDGVPPKVPLNN
ncbi:hypothetical protein CPB86DRAFT_785488 [Serendipita vermifera]|nr:hypothetical protein CPB86DRAFT_785488 [Serendipita vermifera]